MAFSSDQPLVSNQLAISIDFPKDPDQFLTVITETYKKIASVMNTKEGALYTPLEVATFKLLSTNSPEEPKRNVYRKVLDLVELTGASIPVGVLAPVPHGITGITQTMLIYASCTSATEFFTVVYPDVYLDTTNVYFTNTSASVLTQCIVIAEYVKQ